MKVKRLRNAIAITLVFAIILLPELQTAALPAGPGVSSTSSIVIEASSNRVLFGTNAHKKLPMASTTKIMTALVALENGSLDDEVKVSSNAYGVEGSSMYLHLGETIPLRDLLYGLMLASGNDAAVAIAEHIGGSVEGFVCMMNDKAARLGLVNTHFVTPNGLHDDEHYTTAYDLAIIAAEALRNDTFAEIVSSQYYTSESGSITRYFKNKNKLLWNYEGANGVKTGYTMYAGKCLVFSAERDGMQVVGVTLNSSNIFSDAKLLMDYAFANYEQKLVVSKDVPVVWVQVEDGEKNLLALYTEQDIIMPVRKGYAGSFMTRIEVPDVCRAPVQKDSAVGYLTVYDEYKHASKVVLVAGETIERPSLLDYIFRMVLKWAG
ncbi:MAG: D-alanyl-D-alanine carboxypeptidase [Eubacteriales bacterium]|nr:D-alanyl-D-alanine carboxypeptidase [Eubacteriales bacterium]MDD7550264.1 D-alanyl-D-alanine carboxypeptidase [Clostridia bacterium]